jgi:sugar O-acyltransferase (sialic acid O-acetyltransferase NeuD family)
MTGNLSQRRKLVILGANPYAEQVADLVSDIEGYELVGFVENENREVCSQNLLDLPVVWIDDVAQLGAPLYCVSVLGSKERRKFVRQATSLGLQFAALVHPKAHLSRTATLGEGTVVEAGSVIGAQTRIGRHVLIKRGCLIGHHTQIGDYVTLNPGVNIAGKATVGERSWIAMGAVVLDHISIGSDSGVGAGAVVTRDVPDRVLVLGMPARVVQSW